jgi:hypothetical protein
MNSHKRAIRADQRLVRAERAEALKQGGLPNVQFTDRLCLICGGPAHPISATELPAIRSYLTRHLGSAALVLAARQAGFSADHCYTSMAGLSICKAQDPK